MSPNERVVKALSYLPRPPGTRDPVLQSGCQSTCASRGLTRHSACHEQGLGTHKVKSQISPFCSEDTSTCLPVDTRVCARSGLPYGLFFATKKHLFTFRLNNMLV